MDVPALSFAEIHNAKPGEASDSVRERVVIARAAQHERFRCTNAALRPSVLRRAVTLSDDARSLLQRAVDRGGLSGRAHDRVLQVALTLKDLSRPATKLPVAIGMDEVAEALAYRRVDRAPGPSVALSIAP